MEKKQEKNPLDPQTVFVATEEQMRATRKTQCKPEDHEWKPINENEMECLKCQSIIITQING